MPGVAGHYVKRRMPHSVEERYPVTMACRASPFAIAALMSMTCALSAGAAPAQAERPTRARLITCGAESCLHLSGHRNSPSITVQVNGRDLPVEGDRTWQVIVPLSTARTWPLGHDYSVALTLVDVQTGTERAVTVALPPGSLGARLELASLVVRAH